MDLQTQVKILSTISAIVAGFFFAWVVYTIIRSRLEKINISKKLEKTREQFEQFSRSVTDIIYRYDVIVGKFDFISPSFHNLTGYSEKSLQNNPEGFMKSIIPSEDLVQLYDSVNQHLANGKNIGPLVNEYRVMRNDGETIWVSDHKDFEFDQSGKLEIVNGVITDITEQKLAADKIKASLAEKEVLLREIAHRTKNNLQVISSLLDLAQVETDNSNVQSLFKNTRAKIDSMAMIHAQLYGSDGFDKINIKPHIKDLMRYLFQLYSYGKSINPVVRGDDIYLSLSQAVPCALVLTELISNAFQHAFKDKTKGKININVKKVKSNRVRFSIKDDGVGLPKSFDINKTSNLGLKLVKSMVEEQLRGSIKFRSRVGTVVTFEFEMVGEERRDE